MSGFRHTRHESHTLVRVRSIVGLDGPGITRTVTNKAILILSLSSKTDSCTAIMGQLLNHVWYETRSLIPTPRHLNLLYEIPVNQSTFDMLWLPNQGGSELSDWVLQARIYIVEGEVRLDVPPYIDLLEIPPTP